MIRNTFFLCCSKGSEPDDTGPTRHTSPLTNILLSCISPLIPPSLLYPLFPLFLFISVLSWHTCISSLFPSFPFLSSFPFFFPISISCLLPLFLLSSLPSFILSFSSLSPLSILLPSPSSYPLSSPLFSLFHPSHPTQSSSPFNPLPLSFFLSFALFLYFRFDVTGPIGRVSSPKLLHRIC